MYCVDYIENLLKVFTKFSIENSAHNIAENYVKQIILHYWISNNSMEWDEEKFPVMNICNWLNEHLSEIFISSLKNSIVWADIIVELADNDADFDWFNFFVVINI